MSRWPTTGDAARQTVAGIGRQPVHRQRAVQPQTLGLPLGIYLRSRKRPAAASHDRRLARGHPRPAQLVPAVHHRYAYGVRQNLPDDVKAKGKSWIAVLPNRILQRHGIYMDANQLTMTWRLVIRLPMRPCHLSPALAAWMA